MLVMQFTLPPLAIIKFNSPRQQIISSSSQSNVPETKLKGFLGKFNQAGAPAEILAARTRASSDGVQLSEKKRGKADNSGSALSRARDLSRLIKSPFKKAKQGDMYHVHNTARARDISLRAASVKRDSARVEELDFPDGSLSQLCGIIFLHDGILK